LNVTSLIEFPVTGAISNYDIRQGRGDLQAGLTLALLAVPQCMAYALIANLDPIYGLYAGFTAVIAGSLFSSSEYLITGPNGTICLVVGSIIYGLNGMAPTTAVIYLTVLVGLLQIGFSFLRLGNLARFVSQSVITGFIVGSAVVIIGDQVIYLLQVSSEASNSPYFIDRVYRSLREVIQRATLPYRTLGLGIGAIVFMLGLRSIHHRIPAGLLTILLGALLSFYFQFGEQGIRIVGEIPSGLPSLTPPGLDFDAFRRLFSGAFALTLLGSVQAVSIARSIASSTRESLDENQELFGQGVSNLVAGIFQGFPVSASFSRSFLNFNAGAQTRFAGIYCGIFILLTILYAAPVAYYIPQALLAGLIIVVIGDIFDWEEILVSVGTTYRDQWAFLATFFSVLILELDTAIYIGVGVSLILYLRKASHLDLKEYIVDESGELQHIVDYQQRVESRVALIDVNGEAFFGSANLIKKRIKNLCEESEQLKVIVLRMKNAMNLDITGVLTLEEIALDLKEQGRTLMLCGVTPGIREVLEESGVADVIGEDKILVAQKSLLESTRQAINRARAHIDSVLEGEESRGEETEPPLKHTMEQVKDVEEEEGEPETESPIESERVQPEE
jgi:SulP family sulfate permease